MNIIIETDLGRDADDFFALCYLASCKDVNICAVTITPGDPDQVSIASFIRDVLGLDFRIGVPKNRSKKSVTPFHYDVMKEFKHINNFNPDGIGADVITDALSEYPDCNLFCIGPVTNIGAFLKNNPNHIFNQSTMQGGFCSYDIHNPSCALEKFNGMKTCPTFNLNGDVEAGRLFTSTCQIKNKRFVGKNVCHAVIFNKENYSNLVEHWVGSKDYLSFGRDIKGLFRDKSIPLSMQMFLTAAHTYFIKHPEKKFHDPSAAVCMLHPEVATYVKGYLYRDKGGWGTTCDENGYDIAVELDHNKLWDHIIKGY